MGYRMRWTLVIAAGLAGLLLGGAAVATVVAVLAHVALSLRQLARSQQSPDRRRGYTVARPGA
jgi:hypothetical protein